MNNNDVINEILSQIKQPLWENWYIKQKIGSGAFSAVFKVEAKRTSRRTSVSALKIEPITSDDKPFINEERKRNYIENKRRSAESEAEIMYSLRKCPNIVSYEEEDIRELYINGVFEGYYYLIRMEFLNAISTLIHTQKFDFSEKNVLNLAADIGRGIQAAHRLGIIHRDIKLDNFFVDEFNVYKLGDFNISKKTGAARTFAGTPGYLAPEIYRAKSNVDQVYTGQADIYSFGICLYQLMNELLFPFEDEMDTEEALDKRMSGVDLLPPKKSSAEFSKIILKACQFKTEDRYATIDEFLADVNALIYASPQAAAASVYESRRVSVGSSNEIINNNDLIQESNEAGSKNDENANSDTPPDIPDSHTNLVSVGTKLAVRNEDEENEKQISNIQYNLKADGEFVEFGSYHIAVNNTKMPLRWKILTIEEDKALIITFMGIDVLNFNDEQGSSTWENSYIRKWLNDDFYNEAFSASEKQLIVEANLMNYKNVDYRVENGGKTKDNVFLLSIDEVQRFFRSDEQRIVKPTAYAKSKGVFVAPNGNCWWWLRSSGNSESYAADVDYGGDVDTYGSDRFFGRNCVRPAVWISLAFLNENKRMTFKESFYNSHSKSFESPVNTNNIPELAVSEAANTQPPIKDNGSAKKDNGSKIPLFNPKNIFKSNAPAKATGKKKILFGNYYHDDSVNAIPIQWEVLAVEKKQALIITSYGIESMRYSFSNVDCNWEKSSVRQWLNNDFLSFAFSEKEKKLIKPVTISTPDNPYYKTRGCSSTTDYVFLLSLNEVAAYLPTIEERMTVGSPYAQGNGAFAAPNGCSWWWLRSSGHQQDYAADVDYGGDVDFYGSSITDSYNLIRPVMWVDSKVIK